jgi:hypothetical protein
MTTSRPERKDRAQRKPKPPNVVRFHKALRRAGLTAEKWAKSHRVSRFWLYQVMTGAGTSARLSAEIDAFLAKYGKDDDAPAARSA